MPILKGSLSRQGDDIYGYYYKYAHYISN